MPISAVSGSDMTTATSAITFYDPAGAIVSEYRPFDRDWNVKTYDIAENEQIIGVYGRHNANRWFNSFGFIVKVKQSN